MSDPQTYPDDEGPFDPTSPAEESDDQGEPSTADNADTEDPLEQGDETIIDPDLSAE